VSSILIFPKDSASIQSERSSKNQITKAKLTKQTSLVLINGIKKNASNHIEQESHGSVEDRRKEEEEEEASYLGVSQQALR